MTQSLPATQVASIIEKKIENKIFDRSKISSSISNEQKLFANEFIALKKKEKEENFKPELLQENLAILKERKDEVLKLCSNSTVSRTWDSQEPKGQEFDFQLGIDELVIREPILYIPGLITPTLSTGISIRKLIDTLRQERISIQDIFATLSLVLAYEKYLATNPLSRKKIPKKIACFTKYNSIKKDAEVVHIFNLSGNKYRVSILGSNSSADESMSIPVLFQMKDAMKMSQH